MSSFTWGPGDQERLRRQYLAPLAPEPLWFPPNPSCGEPLCTAGVAGGTNRCHDCPHPLTDKEQS